MISKKFILLILLILLSSNMSSAQDADKNSGEALFKNLIEIYKDLHDYSADMEASIEMRGVSVPEMKARLYFKRPDKISVKSDGFMLIPKKGVVFDPSFFGLDSLDDAQFKFQGDEIYGEAVLKKFRVRPVPNKPDSLTMWLDPEKNVIRKVERNLPREGKVLVEFEYIRIDKFFLPTDVTVSMDIPQSLMNMKGNPLSGNEETLAEQIGGFEEDSKGIIKVKYSNYIVNEGIPDEVFSASPFIK